MLELLSSLVEGRNDFFAQTMNRLRPQTRDAIMSRFLMNEISYLELINRLHASAVRRAAATTLLTMNFPANFLDPIIVVPTPQQIQANIETLETVPPNTNCAICQDAVTSNASRVRQCGHVYHSACLTSWLTMSVRCPVCRHDVRQAAQEPQGPAAQTSSDTA